MIKEAKKILEENKIEFTHIEPIGHHRLGRNHVYLVLNKQEKSILKIYSKEIKYKSEIKGLTMLSDLKEVPKIIKNDESTLMWILMENIQGEILETVWDKISKANKRELLQDIGELLGKIHSKSSFEYFGQWNEFNENAPKKNYITHRKNNDSSIIKKLREQELPDINIFEKAYSELITLYDKIDINISSVICHRDYSYRNIIVEKVNEEYEIKGLIDFEHCQPDDPAIDFNTLYQCEMLNSKEFEESFFEGYEKYMQKPKDFINRKTYYMINLGLHTCSWSYKIADDFYENGISILNQYIK